MFFIFNKSLSLTIIESLSLGLETGLALGATLLAALLALVEVLLTL